MHDGLRVLVLYLTKICCLTTAIQAHTKQRTFASIEVERVSSMRPSVFYYSVNQRQQRKKKNVEQFCFCFSLTHVMRALCHWTPCTKQAAHQLNVFGISKFAINWLIENAKIFANHFFCSLRSSRCLNAKQLIFFRLKMPSNLCALKQCTDNMHIPNRLQSICIFNFWYLTKHLQFQRTFVS